MRRILILLAVATITANAAGCCCTRCCPLGGCCPWRNWFYQADYCDPCAPRTAGPVVAAPLAAAVPQPRPYLAAPQQQYQYVAPAPAPMMACPTCPTGNCPTGNCPTCPSGNCPSYGMAYAEPSCSSPYVPYMGQGIYDASWVNESSCCYSGMGMEGGVIMPSPDEVVYPGPAE